MKDNPVCDGARLKGNSDTTGNSGCAGWNTPRNRSTFFSVRPIEWCVTSLCCPVISHTGAFVETESADAMIYNPRLCTCETRLADIQLTQIDSPVVETEFNPTSWTVKHPVTRLTNLLMCHLLPGPHLCWDGHVRRCFSVSLILWSNYQQSNFILDNEGISFRQKEFVEWKHGCLWFRCH